MDGSMAEVHTGVHAAALAARHLLDFDLVAHLCLEDLDDLFASLRVSDDDEFPGLRVSRRRSPSPGFQELLDQFIRDRLILQESCANAAPPTEYVKECFDRLGILRSWRFLRHFGSHDFTKYATASPPGQWTEDDASYDRLVTSGRSPLAQNRGSFLER